MIIITIIKFWKCELIIIIRFWEFGLMIIIMMINRFWKLKVRINNNDNDEILKVGINDNNK